MIIINKDIFLDIVSSKNNFKKEAYYTQNEFFKKLVLNKIPDVFLYTNNIFYNFHSAELYRRIIEDIVQEWDSFQNKNKRIISAVSYKVGSLSVDGRQFLNYNFLNWCHSISKIIDYMIQIINIVFDFEFNSWDSIGINKTMDHLKKQKRVNVVSLMEQLLHKTQTIRNINNISKHNYTPTITTNYPLPPQFKQSLEIIYDNNVYNLFDIVSCITENDIKSIVLLLLDSIFLEQDLSDHKNRHYVHSTMIPMYQNASINSFDLNIPDNLFIPLNITKQSDSKNNSIQFTVDYNTDSPTPPSSIYIAAVVPLSAPIGHPIEITLFPHNSINVYYNDVLIGEYKCFLEKDKKSTHFHFKKFEFMKTNNCK